MVIGARGIGKTFGLKKADKIPRGKWNKYESAIKKKLDFDKNDDFIIFSSVNKAGLDEAWDTILAKI